MDLPGIVVNARWEMSISREEFLRTLQAAVGGMDYRVEGGLISAGDESRGWRIRLDPMPSLSIGLLHLPRHEVEISLIGWSDQEAKGFLDRLEVYFRRGGG